MRNYFKVYRNGVYSGDTDSASKANCKKFIREGKVSIGTHMGEWRLSPTGYRYHTTVGVTLDFVRFGRDQ